MKWKAVTNKPQAGEGLLCACQNQQGTTKALELHMAALGLKK